MDLTFLEGAQELSVVVSHLEFATLTALEDRVRDEGTSLCLIVAADGAGVEESARAIRHVVFAVDMTEDHDITRDTSEQAIEVAAARMSRGLVITPEVCEPGTLRVSPPAGQGTSAQAQKRRSRRAAPPALAPPYSRVVWPRPRRSTASMLYWSSADA